MPNNIDIAKLDTLVMALHNEIIGYDINENPHVIVHHMPLEAAAVVAYYLCDFLREAYPGREIRHSQELSDVLSALNELCGDLTGLDGSHIRMRIDMKMAKSAFEATMHREPDTDRLFNSTHHDIPINDPRYKADPRYAAAAKRLQDAFDADNAICAEDRAIVVGKS